MNPTVLDVLLYLFENYLEDADEQPARPELEQMLRASGFPASSVRQALDWLETLAQRQESPAPGATRTDVQRVFSAIESERLSVEARGFLMHLEYAGILDPAQREVVIEHLLALDADVAGIDEVKWVTLITLFRQPGQEAAFERMEDLLYEDSAAAAH
jgi:Smg protein